MPTPPPTDAPQPSARRSTTPAKQAKDAAVLPDQDQPPTGVTEPDAPEDDLSGLSYEQARDELVAVVARLEAGGASLEESLQLWERGEALAARCQEWLDGARTRLDHARTESPTHPSPASTDAPQQGEAR